MNDVSRPAGKVAFQSTTAFGKTPPPAATRRRIAVLPGSSTHLTDELRGLLRRRLRIAGTIALAGSAIFMLKNLFFPSVTAIQQPFAQAMQALLVALMIVLCTLLWSRVALSMHNLRMVELGLFGSMAVYFAYLQLHVFSNYEVNHQLQLDHQEKLFASLATMSNSLRWFVLLVLYGTFIPNTWRRCAVVVGAMVLTPLVLTFFSCRSCPIMSQYQGDATFNMMVVLAVGAAIAIFGSYRIHELQEEAFQARKLGQYRLLRRLGAGGMGEVYLGEHMLLRRACAIKLIRPDQAGDPTTLSRFEREVQAMATLTHWNTVEIYDYGHEADGTFYYVMEYLVGHSLQELVDRYGPLTPGRAIHFMRQLCAALREAHGIGLIHRDIKPSNVIACTRGAVHDVAKLLDFGLVVRTINLETKGDSNNLTMHGTILGSPPFISPEQATGKNQVDRRTDIYSLGGLAYFLLTGQPPFVRDSAMELLVAHIHEPVPSLRELRPEVPHDLEVVVLKCLSKDPADRFADAASLDKALSACGAADDWSAEQAAEWWAERAAGAAQSEELASQAAV